MEYPEKQGLNKSALKILKWLTFHALSWCRRLHFLFYNVLSNKKHELFKVDAHEKMEYSKHEGMHEKFLTGF